MIWDFDPVAFTIGGLPVRWYGLVYVIGFVWGLFFIQWFHPYFFNRKLDKNIIENLAFGTFLSGVVGGRLGYFLFYQAATFIQNPLEIFQTWHGGMSIHGGIVGSLLFIAWWCRRHQIPFLRVTDMCTIPLAVVLIFGRAANFINGELVGRPTGSEWGIVYPFLDEVPRHPSQLYEAAKNLLLALTLTGLACTDLRHKEGLLTGMFLTGYGVLRFVIEYVREPNAYLWIFTIGQVLCLDMIVLGLGICAYGCYTPCHHHEK